MDQAGLGGSGYLDTIGRQLHPEIDILWTGPEIISKTIPPPSIQQLSQRIQRRPIIWDNLHANDYDLRRLYCGPYSGRSPELLQQVGGILSNPNNEFPINFIPLRTLAQFIHDKDDYNPREAYLAAVDHWLADYQTVKSPIKLEDLILLADCYYLPHEEGDEAERLQAIIGRLIGQPCTSWSNDYDKFLQARQRVERIFEGLTQLRNRELFYSWSRRVWELNEELDLIQKFLSRKQAGETATDGFSSASHLPQTYRGGMVARLQRWLEMDDHGRFVHGTPRHERAKQSRGGSRR
jgi:protein O-GlcNAcase/histone acetyltransferase